MIDKYNVTRVAPEKIATHDPVTFYMSVYWRINNGIMEAY